MDGRFSRARACVPDSSARPLAARSYACEQRDSPGHLLADTATDRYVAVPGRSRAAATSSCRSSRVGPTLQERLALSSQHPDFISESPLLLPIPIPAAYPSPPTRLGHRLSRWPSPHGRRHRRTRPAHRFSGSGAPTDTVSTGAASSLCPTPSRENQEGQAAVRERRNDDRVLTAGAASLPSHVCSRKQQQSDAMTTEIRLLTPSMLTSGGRQLFSPKRDWDIQFVFV